MFSAFWGESDDSEIEMALRPKSRNGDANDSDDFYDWCYAVDHQQWRFFFQREVNMFETDAFVWLKNKQKSSARNECGIPWKQIRASLFIVAKDCEGFSKHVGVNPAWISLAEQHLDLVEID